MRIDLSKFKENRNISKTNSHEKFQENEKFHNNKK
jgi:hypothetical protein